MTWRGQVSAAVFVLVTVVLTVALGGSLLAARQIIEQQGEVHALAIAQSAANDPRYAVWVKQGPPDAAGALQKSAEQLRQRTDALYVVVTDGNGIRYSHPNPALIGEVVSTDPSVPLSGRDAVGLERGTLGWSARGKVPLRDASGAVIGSVSVGIPLSTVSALQSNLAMVMLGVGGLSVLASLLAILWLNRRLHRITHGLELEEMADLLREHAAVLGGALEGIIAIDPNGRVRLANEQAQRYLGTQIEVGANYTDAGSAQSQELTPAVTELLNADAEWPESGRLVVVGERILLVRRIKAERFGRDLGAVLVLADQTDLDELGRELEATKGLTDALRAQAHEYTNRLHALAGLLHFGQTAEAEEYLAQLTGAESWSRGVQDPYLNGLLAAKGAVASESGVELSVADSTWVEGNLIRPLDTVTVVGNLVDNAIRAAAGGLRRPSWVEVSLVSDGPDLVVHVVDSGDGVPADRMDKVFASGWTTKVDAPRSHGLGLALARTTARHRGGDIELRSGSGPDHGAVFHARLQAALRRPAARSTKEADTIDTGVRNG